MFYVQNQFSFFHIPKTGGTSFTEQILNKYPNTFYEPSSLMWMSRHHIHRPIRFWIDNLLIDTTLPIYSICRNPYTRMLSWYTYIKFDPILTREREKDTELRVYIDSMTFEDFLLGKYKNTFGGDNNIFIKTRDWHCNSSQLYFFKDFDTELVKFFKIEESEKIEQYFNINMTTSSRYRVSPVSIDYKKKIWTDNCIDIIRQLYSDDFEYFGYSKDFNYK
jgi:hypothetical protein